MLFLRAGCSRNNGGTPFCASVPHLSEDAFMTNVVKMWNSAFTDRTDVEYRQAIHFLSSSSWRKLILPQTVLCLTSRKKEKCFWTWTKIAKRWEKKEKEAWPERWNDVQSAVSPCAKSPPPPPIDTVFVSNMESVAAYNQKRQIVAAVFALRVPTLFFWGDTRDREREREGWMNGEKAHHLTTPQALMETCRLPGDRSTHSLRLPWEPGGTWRVERTRRRLCLYPGLNALRIDTSAWPKKKKREGWRRLKPFLPASFIVFVKLKCVTSISAEPVPTKERKGAEIKWNKGERRGCVKVCVRG